MLHVSWKQLLSSQVMPHTKMEGPHMHADIQLLRHFWAQQCGILMELRWLTAYVCTTAANTCSFHKDTQGGYVGGVPLS